MKITPIGNKSYCPIFVRISNTEGQIHHHDGKEYWPTHWIEGTKIEIDAIEKLHKKMMDLHVSGEPKFVTVSSAFAVADTVMIDSGPISEVRPTAALNTLAAPNKGLVKRLA